MRRKVTSVLHSPFHSFIFLFSISFLLLCFQLPLYKYSVLLNFMCIFSMIIYIKYVNTTYAWFVFLDYLLIYSNCIFPYYNFPPYSLFYFHSPLSPPTAITTLFISPIWDTFFFFALSVSLPIRIPRAVMILYILVYGSPLKICYGHLKVSKCLYFLISPYLHVHM